MGRYLWLGSPRGEGSITGGRAGISPGTQGQRAHASSAVQVIDMPATVIQRFNLYVISEDAP